MAATIRLDRFQLMWLCEGFMGKSHLRWDGYPMMVNDVWPQLNDAERECIYTYVKRDTAWLWEHVSALDETPYQYWLQLLARYNPANQYIVTLKGPSSQAGKRTKTEVVDAYFWDGKYYVGWNRYCASEYVKKVEQKPYNKCTNRFCGAKDRCLRHTEYKEGDTVFANDRDWPCEKCDFIIEYREDEKRADSIRHSGV